MAKVIAAARVICFVNPWNALGADKEEGNFMKKLLRKKLPLVMAGLVLLSILSLPIPGSHRHLGPRE